MEIVQLNQEALRHSGPMTYPTASGGIVVPNRIMTRSPTSKGSDHSINHDERDNPNQYFDKEANFFRLYNQWTGRFELFQGFYAGYLTDKLLNRGKKTAALDFGCGTGGLTSQLYGLGANKGFSKVYGYDVAPSMLKVAVENAQQNTTTSELLDSRKLIFTNEIPRSLYGKCALVTATHVQYHFTTRKTLRDDYFGQIHSLLAPDGIAIIIASPEHSIRTSQDYTVAALHTQDIPAPIMREYLRNTQNFAAHRQRIVEHNNYIPIRDLPEFDVKDGTQMQVTFSLYEPLPPQHIKLYDTFWKDRTIDRMANEAGLKRVHREQLEWRGHADTYRATVYKKANP